MKEGTNDEEEFLGPYTDVSDSESSTSLEVHSSTTLLVPSPQRGRIISVTSIPRQLTWREKIVPKEETWKNKYKHKVK